jgi:hypothetical protein
VRQRTAVMTPSVPLRAHEERRQVVARVVLREALEARDDRAVGEHGLDAGRAGASRPVAQGASAAGVAGDDPADRARVPGGEVQAGVVAGAATGVLEGGQRRARAHGDLAERVVDGADVVEPRQREQDLAAAWHARTNEAGVAALGDDRRARVRAGAHDRGDLARVGRAHHEPGGASEPPGPVALVGRPQLRIVEDVAVSDDVHERVSQAHAGETLAPWRATTRPSSRSRRRR